MPIETPQGRIQIRQAVAADHAPWRSLWLAYNAFYARHGDQALSDDLVTLAWSRLLDPAEPMHALVAEGDDGLIGLAHYLFHRSTLSREPTCYMQDLFTAEAARGRGVARRLIEAVYRAAASADATRVYWHTHEGNITARRLYDQMAECSGFIVYRHALR